MTAEARRTSAGEWLSQPWLQVLIAALAGAVVAFLWVRRRSEPASAERLEQSRDEVAAALDAPEEAPLAENLDTMGRRLLLLGIDALEGHVRRHFASLRLQAEQRPAADQSQETTES